MPSEPSVAPATPFLDYRALSASRVRHHKLTRMGACFDAISDGCISKHVSMTAAEMPGAPLPYSHPLLSPSPPQVVLTDSSKHRQAYLDRKS